jgi:hypothetical protein
MRLRQRPRKFPAKRGKVERLSEAFSGTNMANRRDDDPADALAAMTGAGEGGAGGEGGDDDNGADAPAPAADDDMLGAPAPDASVFAPRRSTRDLVAERRIHNRRTLIPILLTCGVLMPVVGSLKWLMGPESPFAAWSIWAPVMLFLCGPVLLGLAGANMMQVKQMMRQTPLPPHP